MDAPRICLLGSQATELAAYLDSHPNGHERAAVVMFRRFRSKLAELPSSDRFVAVEITPFHEHWLTGSSAIHFEYSLRVLRPFFQRCEDEGLVFGLVHNHPHGYHDFSGQDDENERVLLQAIANRNGKDCHLVLSSDVTASGTHAYATGKRRTKRYRYATLPCWAIALNCTTYREPAT